MPQSVFHALVRHPERRAVLLVEGPDGWQLPSHGPSDAYLCEVEELDAHVRRATGVTAVVLRRCHDVWDGEGPVQRFYAMELLGSATTRAGVAWFEAEAIDPRVPFRDVIHRWLADDGDPPARMAWARPGWFDPAARWIDGVLAARGVQREGAIAHQHTWQRSCMLTAATSAGKVYFKAAPPMFAAEPALTELLSRLHPAHAPRVLATDATRGWFLMADMAGTMLEHDRDVEAWERAMRAYGALQRNLCDHVAELSALGCPRHDLEVVAAALPAMIDALEAMAPRHPAVTPGKLAALRAAVPSLVASGRELAHGPIPMSLEHGDLHAQNIARVGDGFVFFDWSDAAITHPFLSLYALFHVSVGKVWGPDEAVRQHIRHAYLEAFADLLAAEPLERVLALALAFGPVNAAFTYHVRILPHLEDPGEWEGAFVASLLSALT